MNLNILPYEINWYIANFIDDIDVRRHFNIYNKIQKNKFMFLNKIIRYSPQNVNGFTRYKLENKDTNPDRSFSNIQNDLLDVFIDIRKNYVYKEIHIFRFLPKPTSNFESFKDIYYKGHLSDTHYWKYIVICNESYPYNDLISE